VLQKDKYSVFLSMLSTFFEKKVKILHDEGFYDP